jgi:DNA-binding MarR family transcriptional regulator
MDNPQPTYDELSLDRMLCFSVYKAGQAFNRVYRTALEPVGLTYPQFLIMRLLWTEGSLSVGDICERLGLDTGTVTPILKRLTVMGLVKKERRAADERRVDIFLTEQGRRLEAASEAVTRHVTEAIGMDRTRTEETLATINLLTANLGAVRND